jgi:tRNA-binding protein
MPAYSSDMPAPIKPVGAIAVLHQLDIRIGTIERVEDVTTADTLCQLRVNFGDQHCSIVAGIRKERPHPREIEGKQALLVVNLEPGKVRGVMPEGRLFDIGYADGVKPVLSVPESPVPDGTRAA